MYIYLSIPIPYIYTVTVNYTYIYICVCVQHHPVKTTANVFPAPSKIMSWMAMGLMHLCNQTTAASSFGTLPIATIAVRHGNWCPRSKLKGLEGPKMAYNSSVRCLQDRLGNIKLLTSKTHGDSIDSVWNLGLGWPAFVLKLVWWTKRAWASLWRSNLEQELGKLHVQYQIQSCRYKQNAKWRASETQVKIFGNCGHSTLLWALRFICPNPHGHDSSSLKKPIGATATWGFLNCLDQTCMISTRCSAS